MTARPVDARPSSQPSPTAGQDAPDGRPHGDESTRQAVAELLEHEVLSHTFGKHEEYEVRTTMTTRRAWKYQCSVLRHGKEIKKEFPPIVIDRTRDVQHVRKEPGVTKAMRYRFAMEAVDVHFTRCAAMREYAIMDSIFAQPPPPAYRRLYAILIILISGAFLTAYGFWKPALWTDTGQPSGGPPSSVQEAERPVVNRPIPGSPLSTPLPVFSDVTSRDLPAGQARAPSITQPVRPPKAVRVSDLLGQEDSSKKADYMPRAPTPQASTRTMASDVRVGDQLLLTGWIHKVSRDPDSAYRLQVSSSPKAAAPNLVAVVPHPDQVSGSPAVRAQVQTVRAFITQRLLRQQEPSARGSVIRHPIFVQLTGQLSSPNAPQSKPAQGRGPGDATARWEVRPVVQIHMATPSGPSERARAE